MQIALCDNEPSFLTSLKAQLDEHFPTDTFITYSDIDRFFEDQENGFTCDLVVMDLDWDRKETGFTYAERLYRQLPHIPVLYITGYNDCFAQHVLLSDSNILGYLTKPINLELMKKYFLKAEDRLHAQDHLTFQQHGQLVSLPISRIVYLESKKHTCLVYTASGTYTVYEKLSQLIQRLPDSFVQCHKSYAVNMHHIFQMGPDTIQLQDGSMISVSRARWPETREKVLHFIGRQL